MALRPLWGCDRRRLSVEGRRKPNSSSPTPSMRAITRLRSEKSGKWGSTPPPFLIASPRADAVAEGSRFSPRERPLLRRLPARSRSHPIVEAAEVTLITSDYAAQEATLNLCDSAQRDGFNGLLSAMHIVATPSSRRLPHGFALPDKDVPIFLAAREALATHLLTGDKQHFGRYFGRKVAGVLLVPPR